MGSSGSLTLAAAFVALVALLVIAHRTRLLDAIQRRLEGRQPSEPRSEYGRGNLRIVQAPSPLPRRSPPCDLAYWDGPEGGDSAA